MSGVSAASDKTIMMGARPVSRQALMNDGCRAATAPNRIGVREGDAIALLNRNHPRYFEILQADAHLGGKSP
jgi:long-chain acyl-CoA synthetase